MKETLEEAAERLATASPKIFIEGAKWQQERMYSEKEVLELLLIQPYGFSGNIMKWFEQFKKK